MSSLRLLFAEIGYRRANFALCLLAVAVAATMFIGGPTLISGYASDTKRRIERQHQSSAEELDAMNRATEEELASLQRETDKMLADLDKKTKRAMRDLGFNLRIVHRDTNMGDLYTDFQAVDMPEDYIYQLANSEEIDKIVHLVATLQQKFKWDERTVLLVGILPEVAQSHIETKKAPMGYQIEPGSVYLGYELGRGRKTGETIDVDGHTFEIAQILPEQGIREDIMLAMHLHDAQRVLDKPGKVNQIMALGCHCDEAKLPTLRAKLASVLPDTVISEHRTRRVARAEQRDLVTENRDQMMAGVRRARQDSYAKAKEAEAKIIADLTTHRRGVQDTLGRMISVTTPLVVLVSAVFVGLMFSLNVRERRPEIGILRALGKGALTIVTLFLGKAVFIGLMGGVFGCIAGYLLARAVGNTMGVATDFFHPDPLLLTATVVGTPLVAALASYLPTLMAVRQDPAIVLQDQ